MSDRPLVLQLGDVSVTYTIYEQRRVALGQLVQQRFKRRVLRRIEAVRDVDLIFRRGESVGIVGGNGSGKSTLLKAMAGLLRPEKGRITAVSDPVLLGVSATMKTRLSGYRNVILGCTALGLDRQEAAAIAPNVIEFAGLEDYVDVPLSAYSSGMRARLQFSIAALVQPDILMIDETLAVGDEQFRERSQQRIKKLTDTASLVVIVSHNRKALEEVCTRGVWLDSGRVRADGPITDVLDEYEAAIRA